MQLLIDLQKMELSENYLSFIIRKFKNLISSSDIYN